MREHVLLAVLLSASMAVSGFIVGAHSASRSASDIPTRQETLDSMADEVGLDSKQRARVREISDRYHDRMQAVRRSVASELAAIRSDVRAETREIMTDEQKQRFDAYCARRDRQRAKADE